MSITWHKVIIGPDGELTVDDSPDPPGLHPSEEPPPRHSADDYRAIAERLKTLGYRKWITG